MSCRPAEPKLEYKRAEVTATDDGWFHLRYGDEWITCGNDNRKSFLDAIAKQLNDCIMRDEELSMRDGRPDPKYVSKMSCVCRVCGFAVVDSDICLGCEKKEKEKQGT